MADIRLTSDGKVILKAGAVSCTCCCPTVLPGFVYDSIQASKAKQGKQECGEFVEGGRPRWYRSMTGEGSIVNKAANDGDCGCSEANGGDQATSIEYSGTSTVDLDGNFTSYMQTRNGAGGGDGDPLLKCSITKFSAWVDVLGWFGGFACVSADCSSPLASGGTSYDATSVTLFGCGCKTVLNRSYDGSLMFTLGDEYTDEALYNHVVNSMPDYDDDRNDTAGSYRDESEDGSELDLRFTKGFVPLATVDNLVNGKSYNLIYKVRWSPKSGTPVDGAEQTYNFTYSTGQTHAGPITVPEATANGTNELHQVRWECPSS